MHFFANTKTLADEHKFSAWLSKHRKMEWIVYAKRLFAGSDAVLKYLARYTHRVVIANSRLVSMDNDSVSFRWKKHPVKAQYRQRVMQLAHNEFIRRFLLHIQPYGFHRIPHYGLVANAGKRNLKQTRLLLHVSVVEPLVQEAVEITKLDRTAPFLCPKCHAPMVIIELLVGINYPRAPPEKLINPVEIIALIK